MVAIALLLDEAASASDEDSRSKLIDEALTLFRSATQRQLVELYGPQLEPVFSNSLEPVQANTAEIYSFALQEKLVHVVRLESGLQLYEADVTRDRLANSIKYFIQELQISSSFGGMERASAGIFRWVVQPYLNDVRQAGIEKLVFVSSDTLAPLPFATLFDNRRYLIDDFEVLRSFGKVVAPINQSSLQSKASQNQLSLAEATAEEADNAYVVNPLQDSITVSRSNRVPSDDFPALALMSSHLVTGADVNLVSLWPINDGARTQLLELFQAELALGASYAAAMRAAQLEFKSSSRYGHPFLWGGFMVVEP